MAPAAGTPSAAREQGHRKYVLWPHRSLSPRGVTLVLAAMATGLAAPILLVSEFQAWPLVIAALATFAIVATAFWCNIKAARFHEVIDVSAKRILVERIGPACAYRRFEFDTHWVRVVVETTQYVEHKLTLRQSGRSCAIGTFLAPEERLSLAESLKERLDHDRLGWTRSAR